MAEKNKFLMYKNKPIVREGDMVYYGYPYEPYLVMMQILNKEKDQELDMSGKIIVRMMSTDEKLDVTERVVKNAEKVGMFDALNIASIWLEQALKA